MGNEAGIKLFISACLEVTKNKKSKCPLVEDRLNDGTSMQ